MRVSRLQVSQNRDRDDRRRAAQNVALGGPPANAQAYDTIAKLEGPAPRRRAVRPRSLQPGWNDDRVPFPFERRRTRGLGLGVISAAVAPGPLLHSDRRVRRVAGTGLNDNPFTALALANPPTVSRAIPKSPESSKMSGAVRLVGRRAGGSAERRLSRFPDLTERRVRHQLHARVSGWLERWFPKRISASGSSSRGTRPNSRRSITTCTRCRRERCGGRSR